MATNAGGGNCVDIACKSCYSQRILRYISEITEKPNFDHGSFSSLICQWERLLSDSSILPYCYKLHGPGGFIYLVGKSYVSCHQLDLLENSPYSEQPLYVYRFEQLMEQVLSK